MIHKLVGQHLAQLMAPRVHRIMHVECACGWHGEALVWQLHVEYAR